MNKGNGDKEKALLEKEKAIEVIKSLLTNTCTTLNTKYLKSHSKVALFFKDHIFEIDGEEEKFIRYMSLKIPISSKEYKELLAMFMNEVQRRAQDTSLKKLDELQHLIGSRT